MQRVQKQVAVFEHECSVHECINKPNCKTSSDMVKQYKTKVTSIQNHQCNATQMGSHIPSHDQQKQSMYTSIQLQVSILKKQLSIELNTSSTKSADDSYSMIQ